MDIFGKRDKEKKAKKGPLQKLPGRRQFWANFLTTLLIFFILITGYSFFLDDTREMQEIPISLLATQIEAGQVAGIVVKGEELEVTYKNEATVISKKEKDAPLTETLKNYGVTPEELSGVKVEVTEEGGFRFFLITFGPLLLPILLLVFLFWFLSRQVRGAGMQAFTFGQSKARMITPDDKEQKVTFKDVAGAKEAKEELAEIVDFLRNPKKFLSIGARIPKGILLMGAPGTGKTLLARAVAGEASVPFFIISGSEFVEMFVGVGASRVRDLFKMAKKIAPAIIFIDEIDAVGRVRGSGIGGGHDEREQTLNQILVEMDGFEPQEKVIIMSATNRPDVLDPALLRPGRFDRRVVIDLPDRKEREGILRIHARKKPLAEDVNITTVAERTPGLSGADLANLMNEGAILAARESRKKVSQFDLIRSIEKVMLGPERRSHVLNKKEKEITAYHEAGHALVASILPYADPVHKISIISRGRAAGYTLKLPFEERRMQSKREFIDDITSALGGYVAEKLVFEDLTTGPSNDLQVLTALARNMVTKWGMSEKFGPVALEGEASQPLFGGGLGEKEYSERISAEIDGEVSKIITEAYKKAEHIITKNRKALEAIAQKLVEVESLEREAFEKILIANGITPKQKEDIEHSK